MTSTVSLGRLPAVSDVTGANSYLAAIAQPPSNLPHHLDSQHLRASGCCSWRAGASPGSSLPLTPHTQSVSKSSRLRLGPNPFPPCPRWSGRHHLPATPRRLFSNTALPGSNPPVESSHRPEGSCCPQRGPGPHPALHIPRALTSSPLLWPHQLSSAS